MDISAANTGDMAVRRLARDQQITPVVHNKPNTTFTGEQIIAQAGAEVSEEMWNQKPHKGVKDAKKVERKHTEEAHDSVKIENIEYTQSDNPRDDDDDQPHFLDVRV